MTDEVAELQGEALPENNVEPENTGEAASEESAPASSEDSSAEDQPKKKGGVQKRIDELTAQRAEAQRQTEQLLEQNRQLQEALLKRAEEPKQPAPEATPEPKLDDYGSYEEYVAALADFKATERVQAILSEQELKRADEAAAQSREQQQRAFYEKAETFKAERPDFDTVAYNPLLAVTPEMADVINTSEQGPALLYHLGQNMTEAQRIAALPPVIQAAELGRIEARLAMPQANRNSAAPEPIEPVAGGGEAGPAKHPSEAKSMSEYVRLRNS